MIKRQLLAAAALIVAVNALVLVGVARNRSGVGPSLILSERELPQAWSSPGEENSGVSLSLNLYHWLPGYWRDWRSSGEPWLVGEKLRALGFDLTVPTDYEEADRFAHRQGARGAIAVLELGGRPWEAWLADVEGGLAQIERDLSTSKHSLKELEDERKTAVREREVGSRLFVVDVGSTADALRIAIPAEARSFLVPAEVRLVVHCEGTGTACPPDRRQLRGVVRLLIDEVSVPKQIQAALPRGTGSDPPIRLSSSPDLAPRYEVTLRVGSRHEPWIEGIRPLIPQR